MRRRRADAFLLLYAQQRVLPSALGIVCDIVGPNGLQVTAVSPHIPASVTSTQARCSLSAPLRAHFAAGHCADAHGRQQGLPPLHLDVAWLASFCTAWAGLLSDLSAGLGYDINVVGSPLRRRAAWT
jgi:hypothetical protein